MRRGSPNPQGGYEMPMGAPQPPPRGPQQTPGYPPLMSPPVMSPTEQAQLQMSQSMTQMMQMQMQWMQQMTSMMGQNPNMPQMPQMHQSGNPMMTMPGTPPMPPMHQNGGSMMTPNGTPGRPQSVPLQNVPNGGANQRTMSTLTPSMAGWTRSSPAVPQIHGAGSIYAPSIAPSERSNVGLASRYRPVTTMPHEPENKWQRRASTFTSSTFRPWGNENGHSKLATSTIRNVQTADDEDDEQGWADMKARKEKKKKSWKLRKGGDNTLQELYNAPV